MRRSGRQTGLLRNLRQYGVAALFLAIAAAAAAEPAVAPPLPLPTGPVVYVSTEPELQDAVRQLTTGMTIMIMPGTYRLSRTLAVGGSLRSVTIRGASDDPRDVVLLGPGMTESSSPVASGVWSGEDVQELMIANLTLRDFPFHCIIFNAGVELPHLYNLVLADAGQQIVKSNPDGVGGGVDNGIVEYSVIEFTVTSRDWYTNGVDVLGGRNWIVRHNLFRNIRAPQGQLAGPALLVWRGAANTIAEGNTFIDCQRPIAFGLEATTGPPDHSGGVIRNNFIYRRATQPGDAGIGVNASPGTLVAHNTVVLSGTYPVAIEYRFPQTSDVRIVNNLTDAAILRRDGAQAAVEHNHTGATPALFVDAESGDLHLRSSASAAINAGAALIDVKVDWDWDGESRVMGPSPDLGADELNPASAAPFAVPRKIRLSR
jgi:hypothetical protein